MVWTAYPKSVLPNRGVAQVRMEAHTQNVSESEWEAKFVTTRRKEVGRQQQTPVTMPRTRVPYGLGWGFGDKPVPIAKNMKVVEEVLRRRLAGETLQAIADELNSRRVPSPRGKKWLTSSVNAIVRHREHYAPFLKTPRKP